MKDLNVHKNIDEIGVRAAQLSSFIVVLTGAAIICISATKTKAGLSVVMKDLFPSNIYVLVALMVMSFILCTFSLLKNDKDKHVSFIKEFFRHIGIQSGAIIIIFGLLSRIL